MDNLKEIFVMAANSDGETYLVYGETKEDLERIKTHPDWLIEDTQYADEIERVFIPAERYDELDSSGVIVKFEE